MSLKINKPPDEPDQPKQKYWIGRDKAKVEITIVPTDKHYYARFKAAKRLGVAMDKLNDEPDTYEPDWSHSREPENH